MAMTNSIEENLLALLSVPAFAAIRAVSEQATMGTVAIAPLARLTVAMFAHAESRQIYLSCSGSEHAILDGGEMNPTAL